MQDFISILMNHFTARPRVCPTCRPIAMDISIDGHTVTFIQTLRFACFQILAVMKAPFVIGIIASMIVD